MKIIELLNKIANGENFPKKIKFDNKIYEYCIFDYQRIPKDDDAPHYLFGDVIGINKDELNIEIEEIKKKTLVFDFDGVIHKGYKGYRDGSIYGEIDYELLDYIKFLMDRYYIVISSNRPAEQIVEFMNKLKYKGLKFELFPKENDGIFFEKDDVIGVTNQKAVGIMYIDDRAFKWENNLEELQEILEED